MIIFSLVIFTQSGSPVSAAETQTTSIDTNATSQIEVAPDTAYINANITITSESKNDAYNINKANTNSLINSLTGAGLSKNDIKTTSFYANSYIDRVVVDPNAPKPVYNDVKKYQTTSNFKINIRDISKVPDIIDRILDVDNVNVSNITYGINNITKYKQEAIKQAVQLAKENITFAADAANLKLVRVQSMTVDFNNNPYTPYPIYTKEVQAADSSQMYQNPENIKISATVHLVYLAK